MYDIYLTMYFGLLRQAARCYALKGPLWPRTGLSSCGRNGHPHQTADRPAAGSRQLVEQRLGFFQVGGVEALGEPPIDRGEQLARLAPPALLVPEPGEAGRGAQFPELGVLLLCECKCPPIAGLRCRTVAGLSKKTPSQTKGLG